MHDRGSLALPRIGAQRVRESWHDHFAETPDVLKSSTRQQTIVPVLDLEIGGGDFITMAGPCSVETEFQLMATAHHVRRGGARILRGGAFKPRSSPYAFQGHGLAGLKMLARAREESGLAIVTEVMSECDVPMVAEYADILQIGTRNMENFSLLEAAARSGRPILLKRGMMATVADLLRSAQLILDHGNPNVILCERGIRTFETATRNTFDVAAIALLNISHIFRLSPIRAMRLVIATWCLRWRASPSLPMPTAFWSKYIPIRTGHGAMENSRWTSPNSMT